MVKNNKKKVIQAAILGSLVGTLTGFFLAPKSGQELRKDLTGQVRKVGDKAIDIKDKAQSAMQTIENKTQVTINNGKSWIQKGKRVLSNLKIMVSEIRNGALTKTSSINELEAVNSSNSTEEFSQDNDRF